MRLIIILLFGCLFTPSLWAEPPILKQLTQELDQAEHNKNLPKQSEVVEALRSAIDWQNEYQKAQSRIATYQDIINNFPKLTADLQKKLNNSFYTKEVPANLPPAEYDQLILQTSSQLLDLYHKLQQEQEHTREINDSLITLPKLQSDARKALTEAENRLQNFPVSNQPLSQAQLSQLQSEVTARKAQVTSLELEQLSANNRQEISRLQAEYFKRKYDQLDIYLQALRNSLNTQRQKEAEFALKQTEKFAEQHSQLPNSIRNLLQNNRELSFALNQQAQRMEKISIQQQQVVTQILQVKQALNTIMEQAQWLRASPVLGETLRGQVAKLPEKPKSQQLDGEMAELRVQRLHYEEMLEDLRIEPNFTQDDGKPLAADQRLLANKQLTTQRELLTSLISGSDTQILELTKLKISNSQLVETLNDVNDATHRYLFWVADVIPIDLSYPFDVVRDLHKILSLDSLGQLSGALLMMLQNIDTLLTICGAILLMIISIYSRRTYHAFLARAASRIGKVTQDEFTLTLRTVFWSILIALPIPVLWAALGFGLQSAWSYPIATAFGDGVTATLPLLWVFMISASFAHPQGLFIAHFHWRPEKVARVLRYYRLSIWLIVPLIMVLISLDNFNDREHSATLGRLCFLLLCVAVFILTSSLKRAGIPLYLDNNGSGDNLINHTLWWLLLTAPIAAAIAAIVGYLGTAEVLLARLESSVAIWFTLLLVYYIIRRWMLIQRRRIAFERAKQRRAEILAQRARHNEEDGQTPGTSSATFSSEANAEIEEPIVDLDEISAQSLRLVRFIINMVAFVCMVLLWSELHSAFSFLGNINLWEVTTHSRGIEVTQPITLGSILIVILALIVTLQLVRNLPALLELVLLQHLNLAPGSNYAITALTKYVLTVIGIMVGFYLIGLDWVKLQWLVAALGVGLGFGLQEIFANLISGLIILFEKPIRIGDTVTIRDLTGSITKINTRATTLSDWDKKEIIVPNKAFITEQFINWSLSDTITRVVLTVPATAEADSEEVTQILLQAANDSPLVLETPPPEVYLVDLQQGLQLFEMRVYAAEMGHRMPIRHEVHQRILRYYQEKGLLLPFPPLQIRADILTRGKNSVVSSQHKTGGI